VALHDESQLSPFVRGAIAEWPRFVEFDRAAVATKVRKRGWISYTKNS
jgi:hypothetical protein